MQTHHIILMTSKNKFKVAHNTLSAFTIETVVVTIDFIQYAFVQNKTVDKEYNQYYHQTVDKQCPFLQNNRLLLQTMTAQAAQLKQWLIKNGQHNDRSTAIYNNITHGLN